MQLLKQRICKYPQLNIWIYVTWSTFLCVTITIQPVQTLQRLLKSYIFHNPFRLHDMKDVQITSSQTESKENLSFCSLTIIERLSGKIKRGKKAIIQNNWPPPKFIWYTIEKYTGFITCVSVLAETEGIFATIQWEDQDSFSCFKPEQPMLFQYLPEGKFNREKNC